MQLHSCKDKTKFKNKFFEFRGNFYLATISVPIRFGIIAAIITIPLTFSKVVLWVTITIPNPPLVAGYRGFRGCGCRGCRSRCSGGWRWLANTLLNIITLKKIRSLLLKIRSYVSTIRIPTRVGIIAAIIAIPLTFSKVILWVTIPIPNPSLVAGYRGVSCCGCCGWGCWWQIITNIRSN